MANPTNRTSRTRKRMRRANWKATAPQFGTCPQCHEAKMPHIVCGSCGFYKGREIVAKVD